jgi:LDH2 family malate/lactate/ureidoglycolate dehydrogenase
MPADSTERVHLSVAEARALSERAMRGIGYETEEARILADHVIDAALALEKRKRSPPRACQR